MRSLLLILLLAGCTVVPQQFDSVLYDHYVRALVNISRVDCSEPKLTVSSTVTALNELDEAVVFEKYRNDPLLIESTDLIRGDLNELIVAYQKTPAPSAVYCHLKVMITEQNLSHVLEAIGGKPQ
jgi:hypothetical protein